MRKVTIILLVLMITFAVSSCDLSSQQPADQYPKPSNQSGQVDQSSSSPDTAADRKVFSEEELKKYNGQNGMPAYVALDGIVYDVTVSWENGRHKDHIAGYDLSRSMQTAPHGMEVMKDCPVVGELKQ